MKSFFRAFALCVALPSVFLACGSDYDETSVKDYRLGLTTEDPSIRTAFEKIITEFNGEVGRDALKLVSDKSDANSEIILTKGLNARDGKVGWGQWIRTTESDSPASGMFGDSPSRTHVFSMRLEFDYDYIVERMDSRNTEKNYEFRKLFYHEVGHGLQMDHDANPQSVMYFDISGSKDFNGYVKRVRDYLSQT